MVTDAVCELIIGVKRHTELGVALLIGRGGIAVETQPDYALVLLSADREMLRAALARLRFNLSPAAFQTVVLAMRAVADFAVDNADVLVELDVNPLMVCGDDSVLAVGALIVTALGGVGVVE
jgi:hypothetical protein